MLRVHGLTQFLKRSVGLLVHEGANGIGTPLQGAFGTGGPKGRGQIARFAPTTPPLFNGAQTNLKERGNLALGQFAFFHHRDDAFTQVNRIGSHGRYDIQNLP